MSKATETVTVTPVKLFVPPGNAPSLLCFLKTYCILHTTKIACNCTGARTMDF